MKRTFTQTALAAALLLSLSQVAYANGINSPSGVNVEIGAGGTPNIITVTGAGQVGLNNPTPGAGYALDVNGNTNIGGNLTSGDLYAGNRLYMNRDGSNYSWIGAQGTANAGAIGIVSEPTTGIIDQVIIQPNLSVGGSITSSGPIQVGTGTCSTAGQLQWSGTAMQYCDGSNWQNLGRPTLAQTESISCDAGQGEAGGEVGPCAFVRDNGGTNEYSANTTATHDLCTLTRSDGYAGGLWGECQVSGTPGSAWNLFLAVYHTQVGCTMTCYDFH